MGSRVITRCSLFRGSCLYSIGSPLCRISTKDPLCPLEVSVWQRSGCVCSLALFSLLKHLTQLNKNVYLINNNASCILMTRPCYGFIGCQTSVSLPQSHFAMFGFILCECSKGIFKNWQENEAIACDAPRQRSLITAAHLNKVRTGSNHEENGVPKQL